MIRTPVRRVAVALAIGLVADPVSHVSASTTPDGDSDAGWEIVDIEPIDVAGTPVSMSPDGSWLAGISDDDTVCIWALEDLDASCTDAIRAVDPESFAWAPDSSAIAFSALAYQYLVDSDIHVFHVDASLTNATDDDFDDRLSIDSEPTGPAVPVDVMPAWTPDSAALVFSRVVWNEQPQRKSTDIMTVSRDGGDASLLTTIDSPTAIYTPMRVLSDGAVLYTAAPTDPSDGLHGIWRLDADGTIAQLLGGDESTSFPVPAITSVSEGADGLTISGYSRLKGVAQLGGDDPVAFLWSSRTSSHPEPLLPVTTDEPAWVVSGALSPDGGSILQLAFAAGVSAVEVAGPATSSAALPEADASRLRTLAVPTWADNNTVFVPAFGHSGPALLTMAPMGAAPSATD